MQKFGNTLITNQGRAMLTAVDGAQGKLTYTKAILSTQDTKSMSDDNVRALEQLSDDMLEASINVVDLQDNTVTIGASFNNAQVKQDLKFNSIGWFAKTSVDGQEKLLAVTPSETEQILVAGSNGQSTASTDIELVMARNHNTTVTVNPTAVGLINNEQLESAINSAKSQLNNDVDSKLVDVNKKVDSKVSTSDYTNKTTAITQTLDDQSKRLDNVEKVKADSSSVYTQDQINSQMSTKADKSALSDLSNKVNTNIQHDIDGLKNTLDWQTIDSINADTITYTSKLYVTNASGVPGSNNRGYLVTNRGDNPTNRVTQEWWGDGSDTSKTAQHYYRQLVNNTRNWTSWVAQATQNDVGNINSEISGKANSTDVANLQNTVNNINSTRTPIVAGTSSDDLFAFKKSQIRLYNGNSNTCKNLPPASNTNFFTVQYVFEGPNDNGIAIYRSPFNEIWTAGCNGGSYDHGWVRVANSTDISNLQSQVNSGFSARDTQINNAANLAKEAQTTANTKANASDVYTKTDMDGKLSTVGTVKTVDKIQPDSSGNVDLQPEFNSLLGRNNLLTDDEMDISKATKTGSAQQAISNAKYANGVNTFHYCGVPNFEMFNWKIAVQPNTNYEFIIVANSTNQLTGLSSAQTYIPITVDSSGAFAGTTTASNGDLGKGQLVLPWQGVETEKITFNSQNYSNIYLAYNFGVIQDGVNTDITLQTTLLKSDSIQSQIDNLQNQTSTKANASDISNLQNQINANDKGTITTGYDWNTAAPTNQSRTLQNVWLVDQEVLHGAVDRMNSIDTNANRLQSTINQQNQTIQSLITRLTNAENEINYIKANYIEGKQFPASQEAQATAWENANPQRIAFITDK